MASPYNSVTKGDILGKRDLQHGFHHIILAPAARKLMGFRHPATNDIYRWRVLPFGASQSPGIFCSVTEAAAAIFMKRMESEGIRYKVIAYLDDFLLIAPTHDQLR